MPPSGTDDPAPAPGAALSDLGLGESASLTDLGGEPATVLRLMELGFVPGARVRLVRRAPLGCPLEIDVDGVRFSLRVEVARQLRIARDAG